jgi:hypothetical protein
VAIRYTRPSEPPRLAVPGAKAITLWQEAANGRDPGLELVVRQLDLASGATSEPASYIHAEYGIGGRNPEVSPSGRFIAFANNDEFTGGSVRNTTVIGSTTSRETHVIRDAYPGAWGPGDRLLVTFITDCTDGCTYTPGWVDAATGAEQRFERFSSRNGIGLAWSGDGKWIYLQQGTPELWRVDAATGEATLQPITLPANAGLYEAATSPSGRQFLLGSGFGPINILDVQAGTVSTFERAPQRELPGKCGGTFSRTNGWLDETHIFYHERSSSNRQDGITVGDIRTGARRVLPFFNVQDLSSPAPGFLSFATWAGYDDLAFHVTFLVDVASGDSVPIATGAGGAWAR